MPVRTAGPEVEEAELSLEPTPKKPGTAQLAVGTKDDTLMEKTNGMQPSPDNPEIKVASDLTPLQVASRCYELLTDFRKQHTAQHPVRKGVPAIPIRGHDVMHRALDYGIDTCVAAQHFMKIRQPWFAGGNSENLLRIGDKDHVVQNAYQWLAGDHWLVGRRNTKGCRQRTEGLG